MFCTNCGKESGTGDVFCANCGNRLEAPFSLPPSKTSAAGERPSGSKASTAIAESWQAAWPWARFLARQIDLAIESAVVGLLLLLAPSLVQRLDTAFQSNAMLWGVLILPIAMFVDAVVMAAFGTTPGKAIARVRVKHQGARLSFVQCLKRNFGVYAEGLAFGIPMISLFTLAFAARRLRLGRRTRWDERGDHVVSGKRLAWHEWLGLVVLWPALYLSAFALVSFVGSMRQEATSTSSTVVTIPSMNFSHERSITWSNPVTLRNAHLPAGWKETSVGADDAFGFIDGSGNYFVLLAHEDVAIDIPEQPRQFLNRYMDALAKANADAWGTASFSVVGQLGGMPDMLGLKTKSTRGFLEANIDGLKCRISVEVWTFGGRKVWRSITVTAAGTPDSEEARQVVSLLQSSTSAQ